MREPLVCTPLLVERAALRGLHGVAVVRTGMGNGCPRGPRPTLVAGVGGALTEQCQPGDLVVATEAWELGSTVECRSAPLLAATLRHLGLSVHLGPVVSRSRVVDGPARRVLAQTGALAVDLESAPLVAGADGCPAAVLRAIVDTPRHPLRRAGTAVRGVRALRALHTAVPALQHWVDAVGPRDVLVAGPRALHAARSDLVLVLGSPRCPDAQCLVEVTEGAGARVHLVEQVGEVDLRWLAGVRSIGITAGPSAPPDLLGKLLHCLSGLGPTTVREHAVSTVREHAVSTVREHARFPLSTGSTRTQEVS